MLPVKHNDASVLAEKVSVVTQAALYQISLVKA